MQEVTLSCTVPPISLVHGQYYLPQPNDCLNCIHLFVDQLFVRHCLRGHIDHSGSAVSPITASVISLATSVTIESQRQKHSDRWLYHVQIDTIPEEGQRVLRDYSGFEQEEILPHVLSVVSLYAPFYSFGKVIFFHRSGIMALSSRHSIAPAP